MADERDVNHGAPSAEGLHAEQAVRTADADIMARAAGAVGNLPDEEVAYWRDAYSSAPYYLSGRTFDDYGPAYELGWVCFSVYGGEVDAADRVLANDWDLRKGISTLGWEEARPAARAAWCRADNARNFTTNGSASREQLIERLNDLLENARDGELSFKEAAEHTKTPELVAVFERRADACRQAAGELQDQVQRLGGKPDEGGTVSGAAHRVWLQIRSLCGGASDETLLNECERGEDAALARYRKALKQNLPQDMHAMVLRQFEGEQRNHDQIKLLRDRARAQAQAGSET
jgi:uncharacterized protein (TIGR02284 family)